MGSAFHQLCPRYSGTLTPTAPTAIRLWETFTFTFYSLRINLFLARLFSKKTSRYCHSPGVIVFRRRAKTLTFSNISVITEDIYLKLRIVVHYQKGNQFQ